MHMDKSFDKADDIGGLQALTRAYSAVYHHIKEFGGEDDDSGDEWIFFNVMKENCDLDANTDIGRHRISRAVSPLKVAHVCA